eukprot:c15519_g1_i1.p1 GENE.c15519_g1_i1~~c15519_g1_i1.p1  ORF type:complete len:348 (+),score=75.87 c15519_g1_i1:42-1085(+)
MKCLCIVVHIFIFLISTPFFATIHTNALTSDSFYADVLDAYTSKPSHEDILQTSKVYRLMVDRANEILNRKENATTTTSNINQRTSVSEISTSLSERIKSQNKAGSMSNAMMKVMEQQSLSACTGRLHRDIADSISDSLIEDARSGLVSLLIDGIVTIICMIAVAIIAIFLLSTADEQSKSTRANFMMTVNPAIMAVVWPLMENDAVINLVDSSTSGLMNAVAQKLRYTLTVTIANYLTDLVSLRLYSYIMEEELPVLVAGISHRTLHAVVLGLTRSLTRSLIHTIPRYVRGVLAKNTVRLFYCVYCYREGQFCTYCYSWNSFGDPQKTKSMEPDMFMIKSESYYDT